MRQWIAILLAACLMTGCSTQSVAEVTTAPTETIPTIERTVLSEIPPSEESPYVSRFDTVTEVHLSDTGITVDGAEETEAVFTSRDIIYYEDRDSYDSGNPYGEGEAWQRHSEEEAAAHMVVNITQPGAYRITGQLSAGQLRVDLGEAAYEDPNAVAELILQDTSITCTVAPAILFLNTYECDGNWSADTAVPTVDTGAAGANLILEGSNLISGSHVARIYKDADGGKKLWKQDGAVYSYMSMNVYGPGAMELTADNEGMDTELHLTINGGQIAIRSDNDGINTNEDGVSVTTINAGTLHIMAGLGTEGDGIDSNGYLVINGGTVVASANPAADAGMDSDLGSYIHGGTVIALGSTMDWAESNSNQVAMNLQFAEAQHVGTAIAVTAEDGTVVFAYDPSEDEILGSQGRTFQGAIVSCPYLEQGKNYRLLLGSKVTGEENGGIYDPLTITELDGGTQMQYTGSDVGRGGFRGGKDGFRDQAPDKPNGQRPDAFTRPEEEKDGEPPEGFGGNRPEMPEGEPPALSEGQPPEIPEGGNRFGGRGETADGTGNQDFYMNDKVNSFSGITAV